MKQKVNLIFNIEVTNRTNSITSRNLVISAAKSNVYIPGGST